MRESNNSSAISAERPQRGRSYVALVGTSLVCSLIPLVFLFSVYRGLTRENALDVLLSISWFGIPILLACWIAALVSYALLERWFHLTRLNILIDVFVFPIIFSLILFVSLMFNEFFGYAENLDGIVTWSGVLFTGSSLLLAATIAMLSEKNIHENMMKYLPWFSLVTGLVFFIARYLQMTLPSRIIF